MCQADTVLCQLLPLCPSLSRLLSKTFQTWLRVALGFHTWPQVLVGALLGASTAAAWFAWGAGAAVPALRAAPGGLAALYVVTAAGVAAFAARNVLAWHRERRAEAAAATATVRQRRKGGGGGDGGGGAYSTGALVPAAG